MDTMSIKEVSEVLGVNPKTTLRAAKELFPDIIKKGVTTNLNEMQVTAIKLKIEKNPNLDMGVHVPKTRLEEELIISQAMSLMSNRIKTLQKQLETAQPKIEFFDTVTSSKDCVEMKEVAKLLNIKGLGRNKLFQLLRSNNVFMNNNTPYQRFINQGYFKIIESSWTDKNDEVHINLKTIVFQRGIDFIRRVCQIDGVSK